MKPLVIYHGNCQDGFTAAWACWSKHPDWDFYPAKHGEPPPEVLYRDVYMLDFSYKRPVIEKMLGEVRSLTILDHHKTAEADLKFPFDSDPHNMVDVKIIFDMDKSGARLAWECFHPNEPIPVLVTRVEDRDLWRFRYPDTEGISSYLFSCNYDFKEWGWLAHLAEDPHDLEEMEGYGNVILRKQKKDTDELLQNKFKMIIGEHEVWACNLPYTFSSDAGNILAQGQPFGATFYVDENSAYFSLRSTEEGIDVSDIAKSYGGGGHKHAAGFKVPLATPVFQI